MVRAVYLRVFDVGVVMTEELKRVVHMRHGHFHFAVVGEKGGIHFHFTVSEENLKMSWGEKSIFQSLGLETHYRVCPDCYVGREAHHEDCWLIGGKCWHDGTSLWAHEYWMPRFLDGGTDWLWPRLERQYHEVFDAREEEK